MTGKDYFPKGVYKNAVLFDPIYPDPVSATMIPGYTYSSLLVNKN
jgi:hypothetical protein